MADLLKLLGSIVTVPPVESTGATQVVSQIDKRVLLRRKTEQQFTLLSDSPQSVPLAGLAHVGVLMVQTLRKVTLRATSADGSQQLVPVDDLLILFSGTVPLTAIDLVRLPGVETEVVVFMGETL